MKRSVLVAFIFLFLYLVQTKIALSTHLAGGEITWNYVGQDSFVVNFTLYHDCNGNITYNTIINVK